MNDDVRKDAVGKVWASERRWFEIVELLKLPSPSAWEPFEQPCMRRWWPGRHLYRRWRPRYVDELTGEACCWHHRGDWHRVCWNAVEQLLRLGAENVTDVDELRTEIPDRAACHLRTEWEHDALQTLLQGIELFDDPKPGTSPYIDGRHRVQAMLDAGVLHTLILRTETIWNT